MLAKSDLFVFSSNYEGMPNALMEAMAAGLPCVSTNCKTGPAALLGVNERGLLAEVNNSEDMAKKIIYMLDNPNNAAEMGKRANAFIETEFKLNSIVDKLETNINRYIVQKS